MFDILATPGDETLASLATDGAPGLVTHHPPPLVTGSWDTEFVQFRADPILTKLCPEGGKLLIHHSFNPTQYKLYICELWPRLAVEVCVSIL